MLVTASALTGLMGAILATGVASRREATSAIERTRALYAAESGVCDALARLSAGLPCASIGAKGARISFAGGGYYARVEGNADGTWTVTSVGESGLARRAVRALVGSRGGGVYRSAVFAGNSSGDPTYTLAFGGTAKQADAITGDVYSGNQVAITGDAKAGGDVRAAGEITNASSSTIAGKRVATEPAPDLASAIDDSARSVDVAQSFKRAKYASAPAGGWAWQLPAADPAHIFRLNPSDRKALWSATAKNDYFLEDPYNALHADRGSDGRDATLVSLTNPEANGSAENVHAKPGSAASMQGGIDGNDTVYSIDGNLWIDNLSTPSFTIEHPQQAGVRLTFVVRGNIYVGDNIYLANKDVDGIAFIAMKDPSVADSGNIYFGDPTSGTLRHVDAFMYAENDFYDDVADAARSAHVTVNGNVTAGNHVVIQRDPGGQHAKLTVDFDDRLARGALELPGLSHDCGARASYRVTAWHEVGVP
jgi:hypothetical protein